MARVNRKASHQLAIIVIDDLELRARKWRPTTQQLETIVTMGYARAPFYQIATKLGIEGEVFRLWCKHVASARDDYE
jgi:hypothetical protein